MYSLETGDIDGYARYVKSLISINELSCGIPFNEMNDRIKGKIFIEVIYRKDGDIVSKVNFYEMCKKWFSDNNDNKNYPYYKDGKIYASKEWCDVSKIRNEAICTIAWRERELKALFFVEKKHFVQFCFIL